MRMIALLIVLAACSSEPARPTPIRFLHTFGAEETELFNATMAERGIAVESSLVPFARGQQVISELLRSGKSCPDLIRIDATWLPGFVAANLLQPVPAELAKLDWLPEAAALVDPSGRSESGHLHLGPGGRSESGHLHLGPGTWAAVPQTVDGLIVVRDEVAPAPASPAIADLIAASRAAKHAGRPHPLGLRVDGYWLVPWLRADGADLSIDPGVKDQGAARALQAFASLFGDLAPPPPPAGGEAPDEIRRWTGHEIAYWVTGPWQLGALRTRDTLAVSALAHAPRGGQLLVVPTCAQRPAEGWRLAGELTNVEVERTFAERFATVPSRTAALQKSPKLVHQVYKALEVGEPLPRSPLTPLLFDDLNPALAAVVAGDATAEEAIAGVRRGWQRLAERQR